MFISATVVAKAYNDLAPHANESSHGPSSLDGTLFTSLDQDEEYSILCELDYAL